MILSQLFLWDGILSLFRNTIRAHSLNMLFPITCTVLYKLFLKYVTNNRTNIIMNNSTYFLKHNYSCPPYILFSHVNEGNEQPHCVLHQFWFRDEGAHVWFHFTKEEVHCPLCSISVFPKSCQQSHAHLKHTETPRFHLHMGHKPRLCDFTTFEVRNDKNFYRGKGAILRCVVYTFNSSS